MPCVPLSSRQWRAAANADGVQPRASRPGQDPRQTPYESPLHSTTDNRLKTQKNTVRASGHTPLSALQLVRLPMRYRDDHQCPRSRCPLRRCLSSSSPHPPSSRRRVVPPSPRERRPSAPPGAMQPSLTCPRSCRRPRRTAGADGRGSPPTCPSSRVRWPRGRW